ncbi:MAG TPA: T9SS type A sorting domain-containing protein [bacterium]|nr:T9SS type A sorting domain-containing protein [bacterium]HPN45098.1 T9SS type A sorting domain-containing protein [bacterium]
MKRLYFNLWVIVIVLIFCSFVQVFAYRLINPISPTSPYGKSPQSGPPFLRFGSVNQNYHYVNSAYNNFTTNVESAFSSWNEAGTVTFDWDASAGLGLNTYYNDDRSDSGIVNPGEAGVGFYQKILDMEDSYIQLNTLHTWLNNGTQDLFNDNFDVETIILHEIGHIHGLAHPLTSSYDYENGDPDAPIMAGGDNKYFLTNIARELSADDENGTRFLQYNAWVPKQCSTLLTALNNTFSGVTIYFTSGMQTLSQDLTVSSDKTLRIKTGTTLIMNGYKLTTTTGTIIVEAGATITPCIKRMSSNSIKGLYPTITSAIIDLSAGQYISLGAGTITENVSMPSNLSLYGTGMNATTINGNVAFTSKSNSEISELTVNGDITVNGGSGICINNLKAKDIIDLENGSLHVISDVTLSNSGYIDIYQTAPDLMYVTSSNSVNYGVICGDADYSMYGGVFENKTRALYCVTNSDVIVEETEFCNNTYDIYSANGSSVDVSGSPVIIMSSCPPPIYGSVTLNDPCTACALPKLSPDATNYEYSLPLEGIDGSPESVEFAESSNLFRAIQTSIYQDRKDSVRYDISKYAPQYNQVITGLKAFVAKYPDTEYAQHALKFIDYSYRALDQQDTFAAYLTALGKDAKYKSLQTAIKSQFIPYYVGKGEYQTALNLTDEVMKAQTDPENALYYLYRQGVIYHKYLKDAAKAEEIYKQVIDTDPNSAMAFSAGVRLGKLGQVYEGENKPSPTEPEVKFAIRNHPNPFNPVTNIQFDLPAADHVTLKVYDITGREVITLVDALQGAGSHTIMWNSQDKFGQRVASGMYFYRIEYRGQVLTNKMILMR